MWSRFKVKKRASWGAKEAKETTPMVLPIPGFVYHHTGGEICESRKDCVARLKEMQEEHMSQGMPDIKYNFLVGGDGHVYEGRGWAVQGQHCEGYDDHSIGVAFIGTFYDREPSMESQEACRGLMYHGVRQGYLQEKFEAVPHCHLDGDLYCPGLAILDELTAETTLMPNELWGKRTFLGKLWDDWKGIDI